MTKDDLLEAFAGAIARSNEPQATPLRASTVTVWHPGPGYPKGGVRLEFGNLSIDVEAPSVRLLRRDG